MKRIILFAVLLILIAAPVSATTYTRFNPVMTSDTAPGTNVTSASSSYSGTYAAWKASDGVNGSTNRWASALTGPVWYWQQNISYSKIATNYTIWPDGENKDDTPKTWKLNASADGSTWVTLDTQASVTWADAVNQKSFPFSNTNAYAYYRLVVTATQGGGTCASISEVALYETDITPEEPSLSVSFNDAPDPSIEDQSVQFTDTSTGNITTRNWSFGDGTTSTSQNPGHAYSTAGTYTVYLNATNFTGSYSNVSGTHTVIGPYSGEVNTFTPISAPSNAEWLTIDPTSQTFTAPTGKSIWGAKLHTVHGSAGTFTVTQDDGSSTTGSWEYTGGILGVVGTTYTLTVGSSYYTKTFLFSWPEQVLKIMPGANGTERSITASFGDDLGGFIDSLYYATVSSPTSTSPIRTISYNSNVDITADISYDTSSDVLSSWISGIPIIGGAIQSFSEWLSTAYSYAAMAFGIFSSLLYWMKFLFIDNLVLTVIIYLSGTLGYVMISSKNVYQALQKWFGMQRTLAEFVIHGFTALFQLITQFAAILK